MFLIAAAAIFSIYILNVLAGALFASPILSDLAEALVLFAAAIVFTVAILKREAAVDPDQPATRLPAEKDKP